MDKAFITQAIADVITKGLGLDLDDPNLFDTPRRISEMYVDAFQNVGREYPKEKITWFPNKVIGKDPWYETTYGDNGRITVDVGKPKYKYNQLILFPKIPFTSWCAHHFLPFIGEAWFGYIPEDKLVGASKPARLIQWYSKRPQMQETLCNDVINRFDSVIVPKGIILLIYGVHDCMRCRGVKSSGGMFTSAVSGVLLSDAKAKSEAMDLIKISMGLK